MSLVVDASVAAKWFLAEPRSEQAEAVLRTPTLIAPDLLLTEVANALWKAVRRGLADDSVGRDALASLPSFFAALPPSVDLLADAWKLAARHDHPVYDCLYVALAVRVRADLVSDDRKLVELARAAGLKQRARRLADF